MAGDKSTRRKRLRTLPDRMQRLLTFGVFAASFEVPKERRAEEMVRGLEWWVDLLHGEGYAAPRWLLSPLWYFRRGVGIRDPEHERPTSQVMLDMVESLVQELPEDERPGAMLELLHFFRGIYAERGMEPPEWLLYALDIYGDDEGEELPVELMLDIIDASVVNIREEHRAAARHSILEHYEALYRGSGLPVPEWVRVGLYGSPPAT